MMQSLFTELKRRNVFRVAVAYAIVSWLILQASDLLVPLLRLPEWVSRFVFFILLIGFVLALFLSWAYEITPEGIKLEKDVDRTQSITNQTGRKLDFVIIGILAMAVVYFAVDKFVLSGDDSDGSEAGIAAVQTIAVLPFANLSSDVENEHFADGLSEELLNVLAKIDGLQVAGRTSSFHFKGKNEDLRLIGEQLGVAHILEGSVRKSGDSVRITAQLIKTDDGFHLWSDTYDRKLDDIFAIQDEIATAVASNLRMKLLGEEQTVVETQIDIDPEVYARFIAVKSQVMDGDDLSGAQAILERIVEEAPDYGPAHAALAIAVLERWRFGEGINVKDARAIAKEAIERALELSPDDDYVVTAHGVYLSELVENATGDGLRRVNDVFRRALELNPENIAAMYYLAFNLVYMEELDEALMLLDKALRLDPLDISARNLRIWALIDNGRIDEAIDYTVQSMELFPESSGFYFRTIQAEMTRGRPDRGLAWLKKITATPGGSLGPRTLDMKYFMSRALDYEEGMAEALAAMRESDPVYAQALEAAEASDYGRALQILKDAIEEDGWGRWEQEVFYAAVMANSCRDAFQSSFTARLFREWTQGEPVVDSTNDNRSTWTAWCLQNRDMDEQAEELLRATLDYAAPRQGRFDDPALRNRRIVALAMLGEQEKALAEWQAYYDAGFGVLSGITYADDPRFASIVDHPEFQRILEAIKARNARRLERLMANNFSVDTPL